jgi:pimeloyl-ACP methyl ester carboxylesterase
MPTITTANTGIELFYEEHGSSNHEPILLVMGLGAQMILWPDEFVEALVGHGYRVIRYDNRDIGLSQKMEGARAPGLRMQVLRKMIGFPAKVPYTLADMAADGIGLLDALEIERAHVVGASMGGMIAQLMAINHGDRLLSMTSIMSTTGNPRLPQAEKQAIEALIAPLPSMEEADLIAHGIKVQQSIGSPGFPADPQRRLERITKLVRRSVHPAGLPRQLAAIIDDGDRRERLKRVTTPALVLHGEDDPLIKVDAAHDTAAHIPGAKLVTIPGWGHDIPAELIGRVAHEVVGHAASVTASSSIGD